MEVILTVAPVILALVIAGQALRTLLQPPHRALTDEIDLPAVIAVEKIGAIERDLENLQSVTVIADKVERPTATLSDAVEHNFRRGVKYLFLVSGDRAQEEVQGYFTLFEAMARIVISKGQAGAKSIKDLIEIQQLPYNWDDYPYIFYRVRVPSGDFKTLAFRGDKLHKGIAGHYGRVDPVYAHTIARAIVSEAPKALTSLTIEREQFQASGKIVEFAQQPLTQRAQ